MRISGSNRASDKFWFTKRRKAIFIIIVGKLQAVKTYVMFPYFVVSIFSHVLTPTNSTNWITARHLSSSVTLLFNKNEQWIDSKTRHKGRLCLENRIIPFCGSPIEFGPDHATETNGVSVCARRKHDSMWHWSCWSKIDSNTLLRMCYVNWQSGTVGTGRGRKKRWRNFKHKISVMISKLERDSKISQRDAVLRFPYKQKTSCLGGVSKCRVPLYCQ